MKVGLPSIVVIRNVWGYKRGNQNLQIKRHSYNGQNIKNPKTTNNDRQNHFTRTKDWATEPH